MEGGNEGIIISTGDQRDCDLHEDKNYGIKRVWSYVVKKRLICLYLVQWSEKIRGGKIQGNILLRASKDIPQGIFPRYAGKTNKRVDGRVSYCYEY